MTMLICPRCRKRGAILDGSGQPVHLLCPDCEPRADDEERAAQTHVKESATDSEAAVSSGSISR